MPKKENVILIFFFFSFFLHLLIFFSFVKGDAQVVLEIFGKWIEAEVDLSLPLFTPELLLVRQALSDSGVRVCVTIL